MYHNSESIIKDQMRDFIIDTYMVHFGNRSKTNILSLPADNFIFEERLKRKANINLTCIEKNKDTYKRGKRTMIKLQLKANYINCDDRSFISTTKDKFSLIWLDYCSPIRKDILANLVPIVQGNLSEYNKKGKSLLAITLVKGREHDIKEIRKEFGFKNNEELRLIGVVQILDSYAKHNGKSIQIERIYQYKNGRNDATMLLYILSINKSHNLKVNNFNPIKITQI